MKKTIVSLILFTSIFLNVSETFAKSELKTKRLYSVLGCGGWHSITGSGGAILGEWRECTNIFGRKRLEIVHFY
jgi:hypothetical protein